MNQMLYVSKSNEGLFRLVRAIGEETNTTLSPIIGHALKRWVRYMEQTRPDAVKRAREKAGVWS